MRASALLLFLAIGLPACVSGSGASLPPPDRVPPGVADRLLLERVHFALPTYVVVEWAGSSI
jgi:hypothetical protein